MTVGGTYIIGAVSCWFHGASFWAGLIWPWLIGQILAEAFK